MNAIGQMVKFLMKSPGWRPDRLSHAGPVFSNPKAAVTHTIVERDPTLKARVLSALQRDGAQTSEVMAKTLKCPQREVGAKLSRLYRDGHVERSMTAVSPHTGRTVLLYWVRENGEQK